MSIEKADRLLQAIEAEIMTETVEFPIAQILLTGLTWKLLPKAPGLSDRDVRIPTPVYDQKRPA